MNRLTNVSVITLVSNTTDKSVVLPQLDKKQKKNITSHVDNKQVNNKQVDTNFVQIEKSSNDYSEDYLEILNKLGLEPDMLEFLDSKTVFVNSGDDCDMSD